MVSRAIELTSIPYLISFFCFSDNSTIQLYAYNDVEIGPKKIPSFENPFKECEVINDASLKFKFNQKGDGLSLVMPSNSEKNIGRTLLYSCKS